MKKSIIKSFKVLSLWVLLIIWFVIPSSNEVEAQAGNAVPEYYYANYKFVDSWDKMWDVFDEIISRQQVDMDVGSSYFSDLNRYFKQSFPYLTPDFKTTYRKCELLAESLSNGVDEEDLKSFLWNSCYKRLKTAVASINQTYTVKANVSAYPDNGPAPMRVTFDARGSIDPSSETIPTNNFFRYYRDENWVDTPIWVWNPINYEFKEAWKFIVHLVVRSSNVDKWILDWEKDITINVTPKTANIVVYANTRKMSKTDPVKIWINEWKNWVVFDWTATRAKEWTEIVSHTRTIENQTVGYTYKKTNKWAPRNTDQRYLENEWEYKVTLMTEDNQNNRVYETFSLYVSDPVSVIRQTPTNGTTSTTFTFDGSASYSLSSRLNTYLWEVFNENWDKIRTEQWKKLTQKFKIPWNYLVKLKVTDLNWKTNEEIKDIYIESTPPTPQFTMTPTSKRQKPSEFTLDASNSSDVDVDNEVDELEYQWSYSLPGEVKSISGWNYSKINIVQFNKRWDHTITLTVTDKYGKSATISKKIRIDSTLRPEITAIPWAIDWTKEMWFESTVNMPVIGYNWNFWDKKTRDGDDLVKVSHRYETRWVYSVNLKVSDKDDDDNSNSVTERVFIWEVDYPIAAYRIKDSKWFFIQSTETCIISWVNENKIVEAYPVDRYSKFIIDPSISVNTKWSSDWLNYAYEIEWLMWENKADGNNKKQYTHSFPLTWCHFVDLTIQDKNAWKQDKTRIWFYVKNSKPTIKDISISFPQYADDNQSAMGFNTTALKTTFDCSWTSNLTVKVTAVWASDPDGSISRLRFYYYNVDDPDRILEFKEGWPSTPYVFFVIPRIAGEYKFGAMVYDNDWGMIDSRDYLWSNPSIYFPAACDSSDIPTVTLKVNKQNIEVWDTVTFSVVAKIPSDNENFEVERTIYYDFTWDGIWDLTTKKSSVDYTFMEAYENWIKPRVAVEYRNKIWKAEWAEIVVRNWIKPILLYTTYKNIVLFRDISVWELIQRELCFEEKECEVWNRKFQKFHSVVSNDENFTRKSDNPIAKNDMFMQRYPDYWNHEVYIALKDKYWMYAKTWFVVKTAENDVNNGYIAPGVNILTIPETTFNPEKKPEIFLPSNMNNTLLMYLSSEQEGICYIDIDVSVDSDWDWESANDKDSLCNTVAKLKYSPNYESAIWRIVFTTKEWKQVFQNFYVTFEWYILELTPEDRELYDNISILINWIDDRIWDNANLKSSLDILRKNLNNRNIVSSTVMTIKTMQNDWWISLDTKQKDLLSDIISYLSNEDTIVAVWTNGYEINRDEILTMMPTESASIIREMFSNFEKNMETLDEEWKADELKKIYNEVLRLSGKDDSFDEYSKWLIIQRFCNIFEYYEITSYTKTCGADVDIQQHMNDVSNSDSGKKWFPTRLIIMLTILFGGILIMWWVIVFFSLKSRLNKSDEDEE